MTVLSPQTQPDSSYRADPPLSWDEYFMSVALLSAKRSKDPSTQVGACIVTPDRKIVGIGYNGFPSMGQVSNDSLLPWAKTGAALEMKYLYVCHAELNAVLNKSQSDVHGCTIYTTLFPCNECAKLIIQAGIKEVVYLSDSKSDMAPFRASRKMLQLASVKITGFERGQRDSVTIRLRNDTHECD